MNKSSFQLLLGRHIAALRNQQGLSQAEFARLLGMEKQNISRLENGRANPTAYTLKKIAEALDLPLPAILDIKINS